jgi:hypothetical protein
MKQDPIYYKSYYERTKGHKLALGSKWYRGVMSNPEAKIRFKTMKNDYQRNRYKVDVGWRERLRLKQVLRRIVLGRNTDARSVELTGLPKYDLRVYIQAQWQDGMSWGNYGRIGWVVDHIIPCCEFDLMNPIDVRNCFHFSNLRPMWYEKNQRKCASHVA